MIDLKDIRYYFEGNETERPNLVIDQLTVAAGECLVLCGRSGSGKTTVTRLLNGLIPEFYGGRLEGQAKIFGLTPGKDTAEVFSTKVASIFQNPATQFFHRQVVHELVFPCENQGVAPEEIQERLSTVSKQFGIENLLGQSLLTASGGERQRTALATARMQAPQLVIMDEPTANLDADGVEMVHDYIAQLKAAGIAVVIAEHRLDFLADVADRYAYFSDGQLTQCWSQKEWLALSNQERTEFGLRGLNLAISDQPVSHQSDTGLSIKHLRLKTSKVDLGRLADMSFPTDNICALVGKNGIGKSTLAQLLSGLEKEDEHIFWNGQPITSKERLAQTALVMQEVRLQLFSDSVRKEILLGNRKQDVSKIVEKLGLTHLLDRHPMSLSGGEQQRVLIANALLSDKKIFIFDEPTSGLDYDHMREVARLLQDLKSPERVVIVITHDLELIEEACQQVRSIYFIDENQ